jgi:hypothetical protein
MDREKKNGKNPSSRPALWLRRLLPDREGKLFYGFFLLGLVTACIFILYQEFLDSQIDVLKFSIFVFIVITLGFVVVILKILNRNPNQGRYTESSEKLFSELGDASQRNPLRLLVRELLAEHLANQGKEVVKAKLASAFKQSIEDNISDLVEEGFKLQDSSNTSKEDGTAMTDALRYATTMDEKYRTQIERLTSQQNLSMNIGLLFALAGAIVLGVLLFAPSFSPHSGGNWDIVAGYVSKALTVVFLEVFAFFFLRNYRLIFSEIKYYQQKRNDLQGKVVALRIAIASYDNDEMIERAFNAFLTMPEDKPYTRDHTTESLEREKMLNENQGRVYDLLEKAIDKLGSASTAEKKQADTAEKGDA